jgi:hypothetical protein
VLAVAGITVGGVSLSSAADHTDPPAEFGGLSTPMPGAADIGDLYAWHTADSIVAVVTFSGLKGAGTTSGGYASDVVYGVHLDNDGDQSADHDIWIRFAENGDGEWGVMAQGLPGETDAVTGPVAQQLSGDTATVQAGVFDDPFFFDIAGFLGTTQNGSLTDSSGGLYFTQTDSLAGTNTNAVVLEFPRSAALDGSDTVQVWATSSRMNGGT